MQAVYTQSTLNGTPNCSSHNGTASYETYIVGHKESVCVLSENLISDSDLRT